MDKEINKLQVWECPQCKKLYISEEKCFEHFLAEHTKISKTIPKINNKREWNKAKNSNYNKKHLKKSKKSKLPSEYRNLKAYKDFNSKN